MVTPLRTNDSRESSSVATQAQDSFEELRRQLEEMERQNELLRQQLETAQRALAIMQSSVASPSADREARPRLTPNPSPTMLPLGSEPPAVTAAAAKNDTAAFETKVRELVDKDIQQAYGRPANENDYAYWVPKMMGDAHNLDYWHRRLLGWQAGGADVAQAGPYAGGGGPHGPVSSVTEVIGPVTIPNTYGVPDAFVGKVKELIAADIRSAYGREATDKDFDYWVPKMVADPQNLEYWHKRLLGWQAGGADVAKAGPYAGGGGPNGPVPPYTDVIGHVELPTVHRSSTSHGASSAHGATSPRVSEAFYAKLRDLVTADTQLAYGRPATAADFDYWLPKMAADPDNTDYWHRRLLGWQATGADAAKAGPYAGGGGPNGKVPTVQEMVGQFPPPR